MKVAFLMFVLIAIREFFLDSESRLLVDAGCLDLIASKLGVVPRVQWPSAVQRPNFMG